MSMIFELSQQDKIALAAIEVLGKEFALPAFLMARNIKTKNDKSVKVLLSRWMNTPKAIEFRQDIRQKIAKVATIEGNDLTTREGVISELITSVKETSGKDAVSGLQTLAKLQGYDKPTENRPEQERRKYYLPYRSKCRGCELMKVYLEIMNEQPK